MSRSRPLENALILMLIATTTCIGPTARAEEPLSAMIPVEVLEVDPALATGELWRGTVKWSEPPVALQPARVTRAIAIDKAGGKSSILALTLLGTPERKADGTLNLDVASDRQAWCELSRLGFVRVDCFQDIDSDGKLESIRFGWLGNEEPLTLNRVEATARATDPMVYRPARVDELPQFQIGYVSCARGGTKANPESAFRYSTIIRRVGGGIGTGSTPAVCDQFATLLETRAEGDLLYQFGRFKVGVRTAGGEVHDEADRRNRARNLARTLANRSAVAGCDRGSRENGGRWRPQARLVSGIAAGGQSHRSQGGRTVPLGGGRPRTHGQTRERS